MQVSNNDAPMARLFPRPAESAGEGEILTDETRFAIHDQAILPDATGEGATADLLDLVADHRRDLLPALLDALDSSAATREPARGLMALVAACGLVEVPSPCAAALAVAANLERLADSSSPWTHPAQVVRHPDAQALYRLCRARLEDPSETARQRLEQIQPRLERAARLTEKAASRRSQNAALPARWAQRWL